MPDRETSICGQQLEGPRGLASGGKPAVGEDDVGDGVGQGGWDQISKVGRSDELGFSDGQRRQMAKTYNVLW